VAGGVPHCSTWTPPDLHKVETATVTHTTCGADLSKLDHCPGSAVSTIRLAGSPSLVPSTTHSAGLNEGILQDLMLEKTPSSEVLGLLGMCRQDSSLVDVSQEGKYGFARARWDSNDRALTRARSGERPDRSPLLTDTQPPQSVPPALEVVRTGSAPRLKGIQPEDLFEGWTKHPELNWPFRAIAACKEMAARMRHLQLLEGCKPTTVAAIALLHVAELSSMGIKPITGVAAVNMKELADIVDVSHVTLRNSYKKFKTEANGRIEGTKDR